MSQKLVKQNYLVKINQNLFFFIKSVLSVVSETIIFYFFMFILHTQHTYRVLFNIPDRMCMCCNYKTISLSVKYSLSFSIKTLDWQLRLDGGGGGGEINSSLIKEKLFPFSLLFLLPLDVLPFFFFLPLPFFPLLEALAPKPFPSSFKLFVFFAWCSLWDKQQNLFLIGQSKIVDNKIVND